ncbi:MAG TPA: DUF2934 domain-containing protein [Nitrospira sp.]|nr:DUF2934 domain-containing protein [Nitrospira sp. NTP1]HQR14372.1 DUF2934 domain-containing protein [Nitrospira sp.]HQV10446.1 DUF2934 domain-containing protein [Nitrospira sp.]
MKPKKKPSAAVGTTTPITRQAPANPIELPDGMWERISQKAYELWKERGSREGHALQDWLDAEAVVMEEIHEARE